MIKNLIIGIFTGFCTWWNMLFVILFILDGGQVYEKWYSWDHGNGVILAIQWIAAVIGGIAIFVSLENERKALIQSIKDFYSVAVDTISKEFRLVGEKRFVRYGCFLLNEYFPLHDELCFEEGRLMRQYATGTAKEKEEAKEMLIKIGDRVQKHREKYFDF